MPFVVLFGGELDGYRQKVSFSERPPIFYGVPLLQLEDIKKIKNAHKKGEAFRAAACLAYEFTEVNAENADEIEYRYYRAADKDLDLPVTGSPDAGKK